MSITLPPRVPGNTGTNTVGTEGTGSTSETTDETKVGRGQNGDSAAIPDPALFGSRRAESSTSNEDAGQMQADLEAAYDRLQNDPELRQTLLAALGTGGGAEEIAALIIKMSNMSRENVLDQRLQARAAARSDLEGAASEMKEAAVKQFAAAVVSAVVSVISAVISIGSTVASVKANTEAIKSTKDANSLQKSASMAEKSGADDAPVQKQTYKDAKVEASEKTFNAQRIADVGMALSRLVNAAGELISGSLQGASKIDDSEAKLREASSTDQQAQADVTKKAMDDMEEMVKTAIQFLKAMQSAEVDLMATMTRV